MISNMWGNCVNAWLKVVTYARSPLFLENVNSLLLQFVSACSTLLFTLALARFLLPADAGFVFQVIAFTQILSCFARFGSDTYLSKFVSERFNNKNLPSIVCVVRSFFLIAAIVSFTLIGILVVYNSFSLDASADNSLLNALYFAVLITFPFSVHWIISSVFHGLGKYSFKVLFQMMLFNTIGLVVVLLYSYKEHSASTEDLGALLILTSVVAAVFAIWAWRNLLVEWRADFKLKCFPSLDLFMHMIRQSLPLLGAALCMAVINSFGIFVVSFYFGAGDVATFSVAQRLASVLLIVQMPVLAVFVRNSSACFLDGDKASQFLKYLKTTLAGAAFLMILSVAFILLFIDQIFLYLGGAYSRGFDILVVFLAAYFFSGLAGFFVAALTIFDHPKLVFKASLLATVLLVITSLLLVPVAGGVGAAFSYLVAFSIFLFLSGASLRSILMTRDSARVL